MDDVIAPHEARGRLADTAGADALVDLLRSPLADSEWQALDLVREATQALARSVALPDIGHSLASQLSECHEALSSLGGICDAARTWARSEVFASAGAAIHDATAGAAYGLAAQQVGARVAAASTWKGVSGALADLVAYQRDELAEIQAGLREALSMSWGQASLLGGLGEGVAQLSARELREWAEQAAEPLLGFGEIPSDQLLLQALAWPSLPDLPPAIMVATSTRAQEALHGLAQQYALIAELGTAAAMLQRLYLDAAESDDQDGGLPADVINEMYAQARSLFCASRLRVFALVITALTLAHFPLLRSEDGGWIPPCTRSSDAPRGPPKGRDLLANHQGRSTGDER